MKLKDFGYNMDAFDKSEEMADVRSALQAVANDGGSSKGILYQSIGDGSTQHSIMAATLLRDKHGYKVEFGRYGIVVSW